jgi:hypothetical protein
VDDDDDSSDDLGLKEQEPKKQSEEEDETGLGEFVNVTVPEGSEDTEEKGMVAESTRPNEETESENEKKPPPPPYPNDAGSSSGQKGHSRDSEKEHTTLEDAPLHAEPESMVPATNDHESDFHVPMPGSFDDSGPPLPGQGTRRAHPRNHLPHPGGGWADLMRRFGIR